MRGEVSMKYNEYIIKIQRRNIGDKVWRVVSINKYNWNVSTRCDTKKEIMKFINDEVVIT
jgi:hypothetical protein